MEIQAMNESELYCALKRLMGYVQNGSSTSVTIFQDDATMDYFVKVGDKCYYGESLPEAIEKANKDNPEDS